MIEKLKLSELLLNSNISNRTKIPTITPEGELKHNTIERLVAKSLVVEKSQEVPAKGAMVINGVMGLICVSSKLGQVLFYWSNYGEPFMSANDNYTNIYNDGMSPLPGGKINVCFQSASDCVDIWNGTDEPIRISVSGFAFAYSVFYD